MKLDEIKTEDITKMAAIASGLLTLTTRLTLSIIDLIRKMKDISEEDKEKLIEEIKKAQRSVPEWE